MPIELGELFDRPSREFWRRDIEEDVGIGGLDCDHLRVDCWHAGFVGRAGDNYAGVAISQDIP
jgi:hypothetical protein